MRTLHLHAKEGSVEPVLPKSLGIPSKYLLVFP